MHRNANGAALVGDGAGDGLADPPGGVGRKTETAGVIVFPDRFHQAQVAFLDQIQQGDAVTGVTLGDADHQARIGFDQVFARRDARRHLEFQLAPPRHRQSGGLLQFQLGLPPGLDGYGDLQLLGLTEQRYAGHVFEVQPDGVLGHDRIDRVGPRFIIGIGCRLFDHLGIVFPFGVEDIHPAPSEDGHDNRQAF